MPCMWSDVAVSLLCACSGCVLEHVIEEGIGVVAANATHGGFHRSGMAAHSGMNLMEIIMK